MPHTPTFDRLRRVFAIAGFARRRRIPVEQAESAWAEARLNRRAFLGAGLSVGLAPTLAACKREKEAGDVRVAVVGAGIAGLHCAYRLVNAGFEVTVYEAQDRVGGRMFTAHDQLPNGLSVELGGELIDTNHATLWALAEELGITLDDRWAAEPSGMVRDTWYVNGGRATNEQLLAEAIQVMDLMAEQTNAADSDDDAFAELDQISLREWLDTHVPKAQFPVLHPILEVAYVGEYGLEADRQGCLNLLYLFGWDSEDEFLIFGVSDERYHTKGGNSTFTEALADAIGRNRIQLGHALESASGEEGGPYTLTFANGASAEVEHVVFALPFTKLRQCDLSGLALKPLKREIIEELGYGTNAKVMAGFSRRPWWDDHNESGMLTTDLLVQQGWDSTIGQEGAGGVWTNFTGGDVGVQCGEGTPEGWIDARLADLEEIWPGTADAWDGSAVRMHWPTFQWALGSYTCYEPGQWQYWSLEGRRNGNVHFCGEHCSLDFQGWMEGAAETGGLVAAEILDDYGVEMSDSMRRALGPKLELPQACYHGDLQGPLHPRTLASRRLFLRERRLRDHAAK